MRDFLHKIQNVRKSKPRLEIMKIRGASVIDYIIVFLPLKLFLAEFTVGDNICSDHFLLLLTLNLKIEGKSMLIRLNNNSEVLHKIRWNATTKLKLAQLLKSKTLLDLKISIMISNDPKDVIGAYEGLTALLSKTLSHHPTLEQCRAYHIKQDWFDHECIEQKIILRKIFKHYKDQELAYIPEEFYEIKNQLKLLYKAKRQAFIYNQWNQLFTAISL
ncbi:hypothetical protein JRQ81_003990 [Phrynocephalus forsythii]|uniref:Endonuclease/exonuclease/phosphatase domain-containing protein n=1 Tax=Phrynocephalus forsythii TaxID=171643 RepID=A0A9Q0XN43_9SAUR|nr:hypothetical protein JRQ81_003990 [Phrynocephalus forsythii]